MMERSNDSLEQRLQQAARHMAYPPTPDVARTVDWAKTHGRSRPRRGRLAWAIALVGLGLAAVLFVSPVRAQILEFWQIGVVRIFMAPTPTATAVPAAPEGSGALPPAQLPVTATPAPARPVEIETIALTELVGETDLETAQAQLDFPIHLPAYPEGLGPPDRVFLQDMEGAMLVLVWLDADDPQQPRLSLHMIEPGSFAIEKVKPRALEQTQVNGQLAVWAVGPYLLRLKSDELDINRLIEGHVLIWTEGDITYRLETGLPMEEAVKIAESLAP